MRFTRAKARKRSYLLCHHHIYELILRGVFENKLPQVTTSPDIPLFKKFQKKWNNFNHNEYLTGIENIKCCLALEDVRNEILNFCRNSLTKNCYRHDYKELLELVIVFLNSDLEKKIQIHPPGAMQQAHCMSRAIYCLNIYMFRQQYPLSAIEEIAISDICIFIIRFYLKAWFVCSLATRAPNNDLDFINSLKFYEKNDSTTSIEALNKIRNHLWYLTEETAALAFFDETLSEETKRTMVKSLENDGSVNPTKRLI